MIKTSKEYEQTDSMCVVDCMYTHLKTWEEKVKYITVLCKDNRKEFRRIFGKPDFYYKGEFYFHCWSFEFKGNNYIILTAKDKGTCYEVVRDGWDTTSVDMDFLNFVLEKMEEEEK